MSFLISSSAIFSVSTAICGAALELATKLKTRRLHRACCFPNYACTTALCSPTYMHCVLQSGLKLVSCCGIDPWPISLQNNFTIITVQGWSQRIICIHLTLSLISRSVTPSISMSSFCTSMNPLWGLSLFLLAGSSIFIMSKPSQPCLSKLFNMSRYKPEVCSIDLFWFAESGLVLSSM